MNLFRHKHTIEQVDGSYTIITGKHSIFTGELKQKYGFVVRGLCTVCLSYGKQYIPISKAVFHKIELLQEKVNKIKHDKEILEEKFKMLEENVLNRKVK